LIFTTSVLNVYHLEFNQKSLLPVLEKKLQVATVLVLNVM